MFSFGFGFPREHHLPNGTFKKTYRCFPVTFMPGKDRSEDENGGKIIMPPSALDALTRLNIQYPMLFKLTNEHRSKSSHCGVLEFVAEEGRIYLPYWMMSNLLLEEGQTVQVESVSLPVATFAKFEPQSSEFLDITNPKAVLERALRSFACLTETDIIALTYNNKRYELRVLETKPGHAVSIIECDMSVDFAPPVDYKEPKYQRPKPEPDPEDEVDFSHVVVPSSSFQVFSCEGNRLDGKSKKIDADPKPTATQPRQRGIPNYSYQRGKITFIRNGRQKQTEAVNDEKAFSAFQGVGRNLRKTAKT